MINRIYPISSIVFTVICDDDQKPYLFNSTVKAIKICLNDNMSFEYYYILDGMEHMEIKEHKIFGQFSHIQAIDQLKSNIREYNNLNYMR